jgi:hypothetical protein
MPMSEERFSRKDHCHPLCQVPVSWFLVVVYFAYMNSLQNHMHNESSQRMLLHVVQVCLMYGLDRQLSEHLIQKGR